MKRLICLAGIALGFAATPLPPADAQDDAPGSQTARIEGNWVFKAWTVDNCEFTGVASLAPSTPIPDPDNSAENQTYVCELTARQACPEQTWTVRQTCTATRNGDRLAIRSEIAEFLGDYSANYLPDDFLLTIRSSSRMFGALHSYGVHSSEWQRDDGAIS